MYGCGLSSQYFYMSFCIYSPYGTQALRPITNKWIQLSVINTFDPIIFTVLCIGIVLWVIGLHPFCSPFL